MQTQAIEKFSMWARNKLREGVKQRSYDYALDPTAPNAEPKDATTVNGRVLSNEERAMRTELAGRIERHGYASFVEEMAYTWFNRMVAIRFMELHDYLPSHVRIFSSAEDGAEFSPQALSEALTVSIDGLDRDRVFACMDAADDEALFRELLLAQCNELAGFMPRVFGRVGGADALMLPANLLKPEGMPAHLVGDIPVELWDDVEILGWMYQFYNKELKDAFFASKRKAAPEDLAPATQLFTPEWIVRYMVDNSLGRLWMLNHPESHLIERAQAENPADRLMEYYIQPDEEHEDFIRVASPEDITFCDPACGSGHILVYAFKMLMAIYEECGYRTRDIPELILTKNLSGMEIDPRAAQIATLALAMCAREHDRRFFSRNVKANICVLHDVEINADALSLTSPLRQKPELLDTLAHLGEIGSLFAPTSDDIAALEADLRESMTDNIFAVKANENVQTALNLCRALCRRFDVVVANPPYMGSSSFNPFMSKWMKKNYPESCKDLCTAFIERGYALARNNGYTAMVTMQSWMFLGSFYRADATAFHDIPGSPIAYWASEAVHDAFLLGKSLGSIGYPRVGIQTGENAKFLRLWWEVPNTTSKYDARNVTECQASHAKWFPYNKGGEYRKWYGNNDYVIDWANDGEAVIGDAIKDKRKVMNLPNEIKFKSSITWSKISSGSIAFRYKPQGHLFDVAGTSIFATEADLAYLQAVANSSVILKIASMLSPTLNFEVGQISTYPILSTDDETSNKIKYLVDSLRSLSKSDWDSQETSWDFKRNPLV